MAKKKKSRSKKKSARPSATLETLRSKIDRIDRELVELVNERATLALRIGEIKNTQGQCVYAPGREETILARVQELSQGPLPDECIRTVFREIISGSRALERRLRVAFLGPEYSYSHLATLHRFGQSVELVPVGSIAAVFEEVNRDQADFGLVPLENSTDGRIADTLDMFARLPLRACGEVQLRIHHQLLGRCPRAQITEVYSRPQALSQCRNWLSRHLPQARTIEVTSTSAAAQLAKEKKGVAAIASYQAGVHHELDVLAKNIEDNQTNLTRFAVIGKQSADRTGKDKVAIMFEVEHKPGALADAMAVFKRNRLNLTWIESFPISRPDGGYLFFVEMNGHESDLRVRKALAALDRKTLQLRVLGSYPRSTPVD